MTTKTRKNYTAELKREAVRLITEEGYKASEAVRSLDINANMLRRWIQKTRDESDSAFPGKGNLSREHEEIRRLREENKRLRMEREIFGRPGPPCRNKIMTSYDLNNPVKTFKK